MKYFGKLLAIIILFYATTTHAQVLPFDIDLEHGMSGLEVRMLQQYLAPLGYFDHVVTGNFLDITRSGVKAWQTANCVPSTGYFGPLSRAAANGLKKCPTASTVQSQPTTVIQESVLPVQAKTETVSPLTRTRVNSRSRSNDTPAVSVSVSPTSTTTRVLSSATFTATVSNADDTSVTWSTTGGSINSSGVFTAPSSVSASTTYTITATSAQDTTKSDTASVEVVPVIVTVTPSATTTLGGRTVTLTATVSNATTSAVTWSSSGGSVNASGVFTAPGVTSTTTYTVTASSTVDSSRAASASVEVTPDANFVGWWKLDEGSGTTANDSSGRGNHGTWSGTESGDVGYYHTDGAPTFDYSGSFSSGSDKVTITGIDIGEARTITFWAYIPTLSGTTEMVSKSASGQGVEVIINGGTIQFYVMGSSVVGLSADAEDINLNAWNYITATYDGPNSTMRIYVNGQQSGGTQTAPGTIGNVDALRFGDWADDNRDFVGRLNDIRMYTQLFNAQQVLDLYNTFD